MTRTRARSSVPDSFQVFDRFGNVWPPGFRSRLCDREDPLSMMPRACGMTASEVSTRNRENGVLAGVHSLKGYMGQLSDKPAKVVSNSVHVTDRPGRKGRVVA